MRTLRILLTVLIVPASLLALVLLVPSLKEGFDVDELPLFAGLAGALALTAALWWRVHRGVRGAAFGLGFFALAVPLTAYSVLAVWLTVNEWRGTRMARRAKVISVRETEVAWPGITGPVGVRLDIELEHDVGVVGNLLPPRVVMGPDPWPSHRDYWGGGIEGGGAPFLSPPVFEIEKPAPRDVLARPGRVRVTYDLLPSLVQRRTGDALCLADPRLQPVRSGPYEGSNLGVAWFFAGEGGLRVELGPPLTEALRRSSALQGRRDEWTRLMERVTPAALEARGLVRCEPPRSGSFEVCYCQSAG